MDDLVERLQSLYVWPQSVADHHADVLTPRQIEKLYEVGNVAEQAIARIQALETSLAEAEGRVKALTIALHDAVRRPMGVVPESAEPFYLPSVADQVRLRLASDEVKK